MEHVIGGSNQEFCIWCGNLIPEGEMVCQECRLALEEKEAEKKGSESFPFVLESPNDIHFLKSIARAFIRAFSIGFKIRD